MLRRRPQGGWRIEADGRVLGLIGSTWEVAGSSGYSGQPLDVLIAVAPDGRIAGARLMRHAEPVLTLGISDADIADYVDGFRGHDTTRPVGEGGVPDAAVTVSRSRPWASGAVVSDLEPEATVRGARSGVLSPRLRAIAETGVDVISVGALTHSARALDLGLDLRIG